MIKKEPLQSAVAGALDPIKGAADEQAAAREETEVVWGKQGDADLSAADWGIER